MTYTWDSVTAVVTDHRTIPEDIGEIARHTQVITAARP